MKVDFQALQSAVTETFDSLFEIRFWNGA